MCLAALLCSVAAMPSVAASSRQKSAPAADPVVRDIDPALWRTIESTQAFDNHAHPMLSPPDDTSDRNFDALPVDNMPPQTDPLA